MRQKRLPPVPLQARPRPAPHLRAAKLCRQRNIHCRRSVVRPEAYGVSEAPDEKGLERLMDRYVDGDRRSFEILHQRLAPKLRGFLARFCKDEGTLDDLLQLTFLKAHLARSSFEIRGKDPSEAVRGWYFTIARNVAMDELRKQTRGTRKLTLHTGDEKIANMTGAGQTIEERGAELEEQRDLIARVRQAIAGLPASQREVVELHKLRGMSMAEVAQRLDIREGAARVRAHRGYKALARLLANPLPIATLIFAVPTWASVLAPELVHGKWL